MTVQAFSLRLKELRRLAGLTQSQLAEKAGMTKAGIANLEQGLRSPSWETVLKLTEALGVKCDDFRVSPETKTSTRQRRQGGRRRRKKEE